MKASEDDDKAGEDDDLRGPQHELRSYGRKRGRRSSTRQQELLASLLPRLAVDLQQPPALDKVRPLWLEIGFGGGEHLLWQAEHHPDVDLIGCEPFVDGVVKVLSAINDRLACAPPCRRHASSMTGQPGASHTNIRIHAGDARDVLRWLPDASVARVFILFPDPWPKKRHIKRRLVNRATLAEIVRVMQPDAELRLATDIGDYMRTMLMALAATPGLAWTARSAADWRIRPDDWPGTRYEAKAGREGRRCVYLRLRRTEA